MRIVSKGATAILDNAPAMAPLSNLLPLRPSFNLKCNVLVLLFVLGTDWARARDWARTGHGQGRAGHGRAGHGRAGHGLSMGGLGTGGLGTGGLGTGGFMGTH